MELPTPHRCSPILVCAHIFCATLLHAASPNLSLITPRGLQRGTEVEALFHGVRLGDAQEILFYEPGLTVVSMDGANPAQLKVKLKADPAARLGSLVL